MGDCFFEVMLGDEGANFGCWVAFWEHRMLIIIDGQVVGVDKLSWMSKFYNRDNVFFCFR